MHKRQVFNIVSRIFLVVSLTMLLPLGWALADDPGSRETRAFVITIVLGIVLVLVVRRLLPASLDDFEIMGAKDGLAVVGLSWLAVSLLGALPFYLSGVTGTFTDAFFETASGFTTTGATILTQVEGLPRGVLFWRSLTHWLGGMGIIVLSVALLPAIGRGAYQLYRAEAPGPTAERLSPRIKGTAKTLWNVYFILSVAEVLLLLMAGMPFFDALCHTFGTMATGGFSTKNASIAAYGGAVQWIVILFMFLAGCNFLLHYQGLKGRLKSYWHSEEFKAYFIVILVCIALFTVVLGVRGSGFNEVNLRQSAFQVVSIMTTTGYTTADFNLWPAFLRISLVLLMFVGGCAGSTGGGIKVIRIYVAFKTAFKSIIKAISPNVVMPLKVDSKPVVDAYVMRTAAFIIIYMFLFAAGTVAMTVTESADLVTAFSASVACLSNIGPGLGKVGAVENYAWISQPGKWILSFLMLAGRLELYSILILFVPATWRK
ncbi:MAG: TrkH family potassium uptake protein [bacterium]|nr:TrkH family potassium uptake protein [bacterium]MDT8396603.1 TrkH family potassium uptake protein [bacterium]